VEELEGEERVFFGDYFAVFSWVVSGLGTQIRCPSENFYQCAASGDVLATWVAVPLPVERASAIKFCCGYSHAVVLGTALRR